MVQTIKFSQFNAGGTLVDGDQVVGLFSGANAGFLASRQFIQDHTTATRPVSPSNGDIGYNTTTDNYEYWNGSAWISFGVATGGITNIGTGTGLTGGPITSTGTISLATISNNDLLANTSGISNSPVATSLSALIDSAIGSTQGDILYRNASNWTILSPGTAGNFLTTGGAGANPAWTAGTTGTVTNVATGTGLTGGPITSTGTISLANISANSLLANTTGSSAAPISTPITTITNQLTTTVVLTVTQAQLASAGKVNVFTALTGTAQIAITDIKVMFSTGLSGGGGNRLLSLTDGTLVFNNTGITAALLGTPIFSIWGASGNPLPSSSEATISTAGANVYWTYISGTTDYTTGSVILAVSYVQTAY